MLHDDGFSARRETGMRTATKRKKPEEEQPPAAVISPAEEKQVENESLSAQAWCTRPSGSERTNSSGLLPRWLGLDLRKESKRGT